MNTQIHSKFRVCIQKAATIAFAFVLNPLAYAQSVPETPQDGGAAAVAESSKVKSSPPTASASLDAASIKNQLRAKLKESQISTSWDSKKQRFGGVAVFTFRVDPDLELEDYFIFRQVASLGALLTAQIDVATWLGAEAGMDVSLKDPGNPTFSDEVNAAAKREVQERIAQLRKEAEAIGVKASADVELTSSDRFKTAADALIKKLDQNYDPKKAAESKAEKIEGFKKKAGEINSSIKELEKKLEEYQKAYSKAVEGSMAISYDHIIFGLSAIAWGENLNPNGTLQIGLAYVWSPKLADSVKAALVGEPESNPDVVKGSESLDNWLENQDLSTIGSFRYYVDDEGDRWFIGVGAAPNSLDRADQVARLQAIANLYMPLYSRLKGTQQHKQVVRSGTKETDLPAKAAQTLVEDLKSFSRANTRGVTQATAKDLIWPARVTKSGDSASASVAIAVFALNAKSAAAALAGNVKMAMNAAAVEHENNRRRLEQAQLLSLVDKAKASTPQSRVPGLIEQSVKPNPSTAPKQKDEGKSVSTGKDGKISPLPINKVTPGKLQDDF